MGVRTVGLLLGLVAAISVQAGALDTVRTEKMLKIAYRTDVPPFSSAQPGQAPSGFSIDACRMVADRLAKQLGLSALDVKFVEVSSHDRLEPIVDGRAEIECGTTTTNNTDATRSGRLLGTLLHHWREFDDAQGLAGAFDR